MPATETEQAIRTIHIYREIEIAAPPATAFQAVLEEIGPGSEIGRAHV